MARKQKPFQASWGEIVPGLAHDVDKRWRIASGPNAGKRWSDPDERRAVAKAKMLLGLDRMLMTTLAAPAGSICPDIPRSIDKLKDGPVMDRLCEFFDQVPEATEDEEEPYLPKRQIKLNVPDALLFPWLREQISGNAVEFFTKIGLADWAARAIFVPPPQKPITIQKIIDNYKEHNGSSKYRKNRVKNVLKFFMKVTGAKTLADMTDTAMLTFRKKVENSRTLKSSGSRTAIYGTIKSAISFGQKMAMDSQQIRAALDSSKVLWTALPPSQVNPKPISVSDYKALVEASKSTSWYPWIILSMNLAMTMNELCALKWASFDLERRTFATIRGKTQDKRIPRAATLWPDTIRALLNIKRKGPYVFTSKYGTRYNRNTRINDFREFADDHKLRHITFSQLRDGAYSVACHEAPDERLARVLAGHRAPGYADNYVLRHPEVVRPACDAVYDHYFASHPNSTPKER